MRQNRSIRILVRTTVLLLLFAVAGLATAAKQAKYLPKANPLHAFAKTVKMEFVDHSLDFVPIAACVVSRIVPPEKDFSATPVVKSGNLSLRKIGLDISFQHRAPPCLPA